MNKKAGQLILEHDLERHTLDDDITEYRKEMEHDVVAMINNTVQQAKDNPLYAGKDFYVVYLKTVDRVLKQPRHIVFARRSCPTPVYKQSVWKHHANGGALEYLWTLPDMLLYYHIYRNAAQFLTDKETADLAKFVCLNETGELLDWVKKENGEKKDAVIFNKELECQILKP